MSEAARPRGRPRSPAAEAAILDAAVELFAERGLEGSSIEEIARRAGVSRATVYRRWATKEAVIVEALGRLREGGEPVSDWSAVGADDLVRIMTEIVPQTLAEAGRGRLFARLLGAALAHPEMIGAYVQGYLAPRRAAFARAVDQMKAQGSLPAHTDPEVLQDMLSGALLVRLLTSGTPLSREQWAAYCRRLLASAGLSRIG